VKNHILSGCVATRGVFLVLTSADKDGNVIPLVEELDLPQRPTIQLHPEHDLRVRLFVDHWAKHTPVHVGQSQPLGAQCRRAAGSSRGRRRRNAKLGGVRQAWAMGHVVGRTDEQKHVDQARDEEPE
jgi:hypothetical protein